MRRSSAKFDAKICDANERTRKALELRKAGATYDQIAAQLGYGNRSNAYRAVKEAIHEIIREPAEEVLQLELARLDALLLGCWQKAKTGDSRAIDRAIRVMERRSAYLGLDAPKKTATALDGSLSVTNGAHDELLARIAALAATAAKGEGDPGADPE